MKICIVGGGHIGTTLAAYIKHSNPGIMVAMLTKNPHKFSNPILCHDIEGDFSYDSYLDIISERPAEACNEADVIFITVPHFAVESAFLDIAPHTPPGAFVGVIPGGGGCEFFFDKYFPDTVTLFGFQRVPFTAKLVEYGKETDLKSWKPYSVVGVLKQKRLGLVCELMNACGLSVREAPNYLSVALTPSNPILHTSRIYEMFRGYERKHKFPDTYKFYVGWTDEASKILFQLDEELHELLDQITELDTSAIRPLSEHYESYTVTELTAKINSIPTFQSVFAPLAKCADGMYIADVRSRLFAEDFPFGLAIFRDYFEYFHVAAPVMDKVLKWYADYVGVKWYIGEKFEGVDLKFTGIPRRYGIADRKELIGRYL